VKRIKPTRRGTWFGLAGVLSAALFALLLTPALASAESGVKVQHFKEAFGSASEPTFGKAEGMAIYQATGDVLVVDAGNRTVSRWHADGTPSNFSALASTNVIDGHAGEADATPKEEILYPANNFGATEVEIAVDNSGTATDGNIYVTYGGPSVREVDIFASSGAYLGRLTAGGTTAFKEYVCGVAVDSSGAVYVAAAEGGPIYKYVSSGSFPVNTDKTAEFTGVTEPCQLAAGAGPTAGYLFAASYGGTLKKLNSATGAVQYSVNAEPTYGVSVDPDTGYVYTVPFGPSIKEYDASGASSATLRQSISLPSVAYGVAASGKTDALYATRGEGAHVEVYAPYTVKINIAGTGKGEVSSIGGFSGTGLYEGIPPIECSYESPGPATGTCETALIEEPSVQPESELLVVHPVLPAPAGSEFVGWTIDKGEASCNETETKRQCGAAGGEGDVELTATFKLAPIPDLKVAIEEGSGTVVSNPAGIECGPTCEAEFAEGALVTLTASPAAGYRFKSWKKCDPKTTETGVNGRQCTVKITSTSTLKEVGAKFVKTWNLTASKASGSGPGIVKTKPGGIVCLYACNSATAAFDEGKPLEVLASPAKHFHFVEFKGGSGQAVACNGSTSCAYTPAGEDSSVEALFAEDAKNALSLAKTGGGQGFVKTKPAGILCGYNCSAAEAEFFASETAIVSVKLNKGTSSVEWTTGAGTCTGKVETLESTCEVPMSSAASLVAKFE
jgi:hypothetical protein